MHEHDDTYLERASATEPSRPENAMDEYTGLLESLQAQVDRLQERLHPVLQPDFPEAQMVKLGEPDHHNRFRGNNQGLRMQVAALRNLIDRLDV